jgi:glycosyltransferase involved in cell wall biosynthesis
MASTLLNSVAGPQLRRLVTLSDGILCASNAQKSIITSKIPALEEKIQVIYNPLPKCSPTKIQMDDYGFLGGANPIKGFGVLRRALTKIHVKVPNVRLRLHAANFEDLREKKSELLTDVEIIYYRRLNASLLDDFYERIRSIIFPSICPEPLPYVISEAVLRGRLVIASDIGGVPELAEGCKGVFLFEPGNYTELAKQIEHADALSRDVAADLAAQSRENFLKKFSNETVLTNFLNVCERLVKP